jgi:hypothetical protein
MSEGLDWSGQRFAEVDWDVCEATIELPGRSMIVCPYVALMHGPDERAMFTVDVTKGGGGIQSIAVG